MPLLNRLMAMPGVSPVTAGRMIERSLRGYIRDYSGSCNFLGREYDREVIKRAFYLELGLEQGHLRSPVRQYRVVQLLKLPYSYDAWRRNPTLRRGLLTLLADNIMFYNMNLGESAAI